MKDYMAMDGDFADDINSQVPFGNQNRTTFDTNNPYSMSQYKTEATGNQSNFLGHEAINNSLKQ